MIGETGVLVLEGGAPRGVQSGRLRLSCNGRRQPIDEAELAALPDAAASVAGLYGALRDDIAVGGARAPGFEHAMRLTQLIADVTAAAGASLKRESAWPEW